MIKVLIAEDSITQREILARVVREDEEMTVVGEARNGTEAVKMAADLAPDVVLMDVHMPEMNGIDATAQIMKESAVPIVIMSSTLRQRDIDLAVEAMRVGAVLAIEKPKGSSLLHLPKMGPNLRRVLREAAGTRVRRTISAPAGEQPVRSGLFKPPASPVHAIGICSSAGGPSTLIAIFAALPPSFPIPVLLVQHISAGFEEGFANWISERTQQTARIAAPGDRLTPGIWMGPRDQHLVLDTPHRLGLVPRRDDDIHCPAGDPMLTSMADRLSNQAMGIVLTGMGDDGARGLLAVKKAGGQTMIQNETTAMVWGMPGSAKKLGASDYEMSPSELSDALCRMAKQKSNSSRPG